MDDNKTTTEGTTVRMEKVIEEDTTVMMEKVIEEDTTAKIDKVIEKDTEWNMFQKWIGKCITTCAKKVRKCTATCTKRVGEHTIICAEKISKYTTACSKKISETKFAVIMNVKYSEVYGQVRKALMKIVYGLAPRNETKGVKVIEQLNG